MISNSKGWLESGVYIPNLAGDGEVEKGHLGENKCLLKR